MSSQQLSEQAERAGTVRTDAGYSLVNHQLLRNGYTTGSCAAAAAKAAAVMLLTGRVVEEIPLLTPAEILLHLCVEEISFNGIPCETQEADGCGTQVQRVRCAVRKDGGDDVDATNGMLIFAEVQRCSDPGVLISGGEGIGVVTCPGLDQPPGAHAINSVPREMIRSAVLEICAAQGFSGGLSVVISAPEGRRIAAKTFNPNMGIEGGISILGTTGIVLPMSRRALLDSIRLEMNVLRNAGFSYLIMSPGNYGARFLREHTGLNPDCSMKCSNYLGETLDLAEELGIRGILFVAHIGKFIKVAGGIMNTHSREADARMELLAAAALRAGADAEVCREILNAVTTDGALAVLDGAPDEVRTQTIRIVLDQIQRHLDRRTAGHLETGVILFAGKDTLLGETAAAARLREAVQTQNRMRQGDPLHS